MSQSGLTFEMNLTFRRFAVLFEQVAEVVRQFGAAAAELWRRMARRAYLRYHKRLPGSERTSRLRKKRRTVVGEWFAEFVRINPVQRVRDTKSDSLVSDSGTPPTVSGKFIVRLDRLVRE